MPKAIVAICGGISAYKSCELVRELQRRGVEVRAIMTKSAEEFVTKLTLESLTRAAVHTDLFGDGAFGTAHIEIARWADTLVVAPLTANSLAKFTHGYANDFLSTVYLAFQGKVIVAPAMNSAMWEHATVQQNLAVLKERGVQVVDPQPGELACGEHGVGRMAEPSMIADAAYARSSTSSPLQGRDVLITAGPTREYLDPVRFLSSPSTGRMGVEIANEAARRGAQVTLVHGPISIPVDSRVQTVPVQSAEGMMNAVEKRLPTSIFVGCAAVSDYRPVTQETEKIKKEKKDFQLTLKRTPDILHHVSKQRRKGDLVIGFAAETHDVIPQAKVKLESKNLDWIVANIVNQEKEGFVQYKTSVSILNRKGLVQELTNVSKVDVAKNLWDVVEREHENCNNR